MFSKPKFEIPTNEKPLIYEEDRMIFYGDYLIFENEKYFYENIQFIQYYAEKNIVNGFATVHKARVNFCLNFNDYSFYPTGEDWFDQFFFMEFEKGLLPIGNKLIYKLDFITNFLQKKTFHQRLERYYKYIKLNGCFTFLDSVTFHNNGDIFEKNNFVGNIRTAFTENKFIYGDSFSTYKSSYSDPYLFGINQGSSFFGLMENNWTIKMTLNKDIFDILLKNLLSTGYFVNN